MFVSRFSLSCTVLTAYCRTRRIRNRRKRPPRGDADPPRAGVRLRIRTPTPRSASSSDCPTTPYDSPLLHRLVALRLGLQHLPHPLLPTIPRPSTILAEQPFTHRPSPSYPLQYFPCFSCWHIKQSCNRRCLSCTTIVELGSARWCSDFPLLRNTHDVLLSLVLRSSRSLTAFPETAIRRAKMGATSARGTSPSRVALCLALLT